MIMRPAVQCDLVEYLPLKELQGNLLSYQDYVDNRYTINAYECI